jgi:hypothetical protein
MENGILAYVLCKLNDIETKYSRNNKDLLAIKEVLKQWRYYLVEQKMKTIIDHISIKYMLK